MPLLPLEAQNLIEPTSITLAQQIQCQPIVTPLSPLPIQTTYVRQGSGGTPILLLHGFDSSVFEFRRLLPLLAQKQETWAMDLLGFGFTERLNGLSFSPSAIKTHLYYFWKTFINQPIILVGASMGGATAIDFTLTYPEIVDKLILIDSAGVAKPPVMGKYMFSPLGYLATSFLSNAKVRQNISRAAYYDKSFANPDAQLCAALHLKCQGWSQALIAFTKSGGYGSFIQQLPNLKQSTLILWGENDQILGTQDAYRLKVTLPNNTLIWFKNCGHVPHLEQPSATAQSIGNFCHV